ncbi:MAG: ABC transporter ATP-binding protein [Phenylobacterium sp.]|uniref:ABC transporter ATP-binding protein n=1 Tax=Phenylobacterium sp. TaxID=1871053 RepID=UPI0025FC461E|nr:ABC transporter ATP-binding protein [Phenylobacterium sp.]MCA3711699.1 ABC transporter ATP-binding protein [Phenylobacterium sp.]MCA3744933.1 ABC transporter ATP-binding protein [Phenylobacterium sp.]MCA3750990.1 ABC transporter ATP-binding protein [Phenylobacterium sp.]MCA6240792.1 ABC transporter ATP-binding protein [Phenylobacterium sp.]MCA6259515.1 ABC transporter ATP-binding protein [Phenylobacterium sp.]
MSDTASADPPVLRTRALSRTYGDGAAAVHALREIDLEVEGGELIVLLGPSGSGKSTLLNILGGLDRATSGEVWFRGTNLAGLNDRALTDFRRRSVGFIFQFYNLIPSLTARENVDLVREIADSPLAAEEALDLVGLCERMDHFPAQLSGGEQQRVAVARALAKRPALLLCDEPTGALDLETGVRVLEALVEINSRYGSTTLIVTHNADVARLGSRVIHFLDGRIRKIETNAVRARPADLKW